MNIDEVCSFLPYRVLSKYREARMLLDGEMCPPRFVDLYPVYGCNHNCIGCDYQDLNSKPRMFSNKDFRTIMYDLDNIGCEAIDWCGGGEPTLHPYLSDMIDLWCEDMGHVTGLLTNGTMMSGKLRESVVDNASYVRFSLECATKETFNAYKRPKSEDVGFDTVIRNIRETVDLRDTTGSKCLVGYKFTIDQNNINDIPTAFTLAKDLGMDSLQFKLIRNVPTELDADMIPLVSSQIAGLVGDGAAGGVKVMANFADYQFKGGCWMNPLWPTIDAYGDVWACCYYRHRKDEHWLGNIFKDGLRELWYSDYHQEVMSSIDKCKCLKYDCRFMKYNDFMADVMVRHRGQVEFL